MKVGDITFDLEESLHAESVLKRKESLVTNHHPPDIHKTVYERKREKADSTFAQSGTDRHDEYNESSWMEADDAVLAQLETGG